MGDGFGGALRSRQFLRVELGNGWGVYGDILFFEGVSILLGEFEALLVLGLGGLDIGLDLLDLLGFETDLGGDFKLEDLELGLELGLFCFGINGLEDSGLGVEGKELLGEGLYFFLEFADGVLYGF